MQRILSILFMVIGLSISAFAEKGNNTPLATITSGYTSWDNARLNCKLSATGLPVSPSVKIYMERDKSISISISAIFVGEVGRIEIQGDNVLAVNKMRGVYCRENVADFFASLPVTLSDLQNLLLGRIFLIGDGVLSKNNANKAMIMEREDGGWDVVPVTQPAELGIAYGYSTYPDGRLNVVLVEAGDGKEVAGQFLYKKDSRKLELEYLGAGRSLEATLDIKDTNMDSYEPLSPIKIKDNWTRVSPKEFLKSLR